MEHHVLICGHVFRYEEKAPFLTSVASVFGAIEYDSENELLRCHECGNWFKHLGQHVQKAHKILAEKYKEKHGLRFSASLVGPTIRNSLSLRGHKSKKNLSRTGNNLSGRRIPRRHEEINIHGRCEVQLIFKIQTLAKVLGHTPTIKQLVRSGIYEPLLRRRFGSVKQAIINAGLTPNVPNHPELISDLPEEFEVRMPWPKDYFGVSKVS